MITILDILYITLAIGFIVLVFFIVTLVQRVIKTLDRLDPILDNVRETTDDITVAKTKIKSTLFSSASMILDLLAGRRGGGR